MRDMMQYKGYYGSVRYSDEDGVFYGKVEFIRALISYEGTNVQSLRQAFEEALEDYLETCKEKGIPVEKPFKGSFNVRIGSDLHRRIVLAAERKGLTLNKYIAGILEKETESEPNY